MFIQPWDAGLDEAEWQTWIAEGHDFGLLSVNGLPGQAPVAVPTHFTSDPGHLLIHLARPNLVWNAIGHDPNVLFTVFGDYAFVPGPWRAKPDTPCTDGVPTSYYTAVQFTCRDVRAKFKYDDHKPVEHRTAVADHLTERGQGLDLPAAQQQRRRLDRIGPWKP